MKKLLYTFIILPFLTLGQTIEDFNFIPPVTDNNMSVVFVAGTLIDFIGSPLQAYVNGNPVSDAAYPIQEDGAGGVAVIGEDFYCSCSLANSGDLVEFYILHQETIIKIEYDVPSYYVPNYFYMDWYDYIWFTVEGNPVEFGCTDYSYTEYTPSANIDDGSCSTLLIYGCSDPLAFNYNSDANTDDGSCIPVIYGCMDSSADNYDYWANTPENFSCLYYGCTDAVACNFDSTANYDDGSCLYLDYELASFNACCLGNSVTTICLLDNVDCADIDCVNPGCMFEWADNFNPFITQDDGSCFRYGCTSEWADNYDELATIDNGSCFRYGCSLEWADNFDEYATVDDEINDEACFRYGCIFEWADNYDELATIDDGGCSKLGCDNIWADNYNELVTINDGSCYMFGCSYSWADNYDINVTDNDGSCYKYGCTSNLAFNYDQYATIDDESCDFATLTQLNLSFDAWNISIDLSQGWNMFGYGCPISTDVIEGLSNYTESITITKDNNGNIYMPEYGFNGIGDFSPGFGYQIKLTEAIDGFRLCDWYINDIPTDNIIALQEQNAFMSQYFGCVDELACNFSATAVISDESCTYAEQGYDCELDSLFEIEGFIYIGRHSGNDYYLSEDLTYWEEANIICNENGGHLVTISDNEENMFISNALINSQTSDLTFENWELRCEIGLKKVEGQWSWVTGEPVTFTSWSSYTWEPSGDGNCAHTNHDIYHPNYSSNYFGYWNDHSCNSGETRFILEIEN